MKLWRYSIRATHNAQYNEARLVEMREAKQERQRQACVSRKLILGMCVCVMCVCVCVLCVCVCEREKDARCKDDRDNHLMEREAKHKNDRCKLWWRETSLWQERKSLLSLSLTQNGSKNDQWKIFQHEVMSHKDSTHPMVGRQFSTRKVLSRYPIVFLHAWKIPYRPFNTKISEKMARRRGGCWNKLNRSTKGEGVEINSSENLQLFFTEILKNTSKPRKNWRKSTEICKISRLLRSNN